MSSTELHDELPVPHFEERLWQTLREAHTDRHRGGRDPRRDPRRQGGQRRRARRLLTAGAGSIAVAAAVIAVVSVTGSTGGGRAPGTTADRTAGGQDAPGAGAVDGAEVDLATRIITATQEAVADSVVHTRQDSTGPGDSESWSDEQSGVTRWLSLDEAGAPSLDTGAAEAPDVDAVGPPPIPEPPEECTQSWEATPDTSAAEDAEVIEVPDCPPAIPSDHPTVTTRIVDSCFREYMVTEMPALPARNEASFVGEKLADGELVEDGTAIVNGRELIRVRTPGEWAEHTYYVDPQTYRPVELHGYPDEQGVPEYVMTFEYLPRAPENLAQLVAPIPNGFTQVDDLHGDGERFDAGCGY